VPIVVYSVAHEGKQVPGSRTTDFARGWTLIPERYEVLTIGRRERHVFEQSDPLLGVTAITELWRDPALATVSISTTMTNTGSDTHVLTSLSAGTMGGLLDGRGDAARVFLSKNAWSAEHRWGELSLAEALPDINVELHELQSRAAISAASTSTWTTGDGFPLVFGEESEHAAGFALQLDVTGPWSWQLGDIDGALWAVAFGNASAEHLVTQELSPGATLSTPQVTLATVGTGGWQSAIASLHRSNSLRRSGSVDSRSPAVVYNDWMMTLRADPHEHEVRQLAVAAANIGAEVYCIDAGWFDERGEGWWESVGEWAPSVRRFPAGLSALVADLGAIGLRAGAWLEPEVIGVGSEVLSALAPSATVHSGGHPLHEAGRHFLDFTDGDNRRRLHAVVDQLVAQLGFQYLKFDYNNRLDSVVVSGARPHDDTPGRMAAAFASWLREVREKHPNLVIENCASGAMRADPVLMDIADLQSSSDQHDFSRYSSIAVNAPISMPFWQASHWAVIRPELTTNEVGFALVTGMAGRLCLSGFVDRAPVESRELVQQATSVYKDYRHSLVDATPFWPLGLARWNDQWMSLGQYHAGGSRVFVWKRSPAPGDVTLDLSRSGITLDVENPPSVLFSSRDDWGLEIVNQHQLRLTGGEDFGACIIDVRDDSKPAVDGARK
jgi:alpha-galactosidase